MTFIKANRVYYNSQHNRYIESKDTTIINLEHVVTITPEELMEQFRGDVTKPNISGNHNCPKLFRSTFGYF